MSKAGRKRRKKRRKREGSKEGEQEVKRNPIVHDISFNSSILRKLFLLLFNFIFVQRKKKKIEEYPGFH